MLNKETIKKYYLKNGEARYKFQIYLGIDKATGKEKRTTRRGFKTIKEAKVAYARLELEVEENGIPVKQRKITFKEFAVDTWLPYYETTVKSSTLYKFKQKLNLYVFDVFGDLFLDQITILGCQNFVNDLSVDYKRYRQISNTVDRILRYACNLELIESNPFDKVTYPPQRKSHTKDIVFWDKDQLNVFSIISKPDQSKCK